tara:strand:- start:12 stop:545 length:534 start_codon:yes stop_codon:yes gene_type:complete
MPGSLIKIDEEIVTSSTASVILSGISSTYDVYMVKINNFTHDHTTGNSINIRFTKDVSGTPTPVTSANYQRALRELRADSAFSNVYVSVNATAIFSSDVGDLSTEQGNLLMYLFNFNNASEYSFITHESEAINSDANLRGRMGGAILTIAEAHNGMQIFFSTGNVTSGTFTLYGLKK